VEGEDESANAAATIAVGEGSGEAPGWDEGMDAELLGAVTEVILRARALEHAGLSDEASIQMRLNGQSTDAIVAWLDQARAELDGMEVPEAEVVPEPEIEPVEPAADDEAQGRLT